MVKKVTLNLDQEAYDQLRWYSFDKKISMSEVIRKGIILSMKEDFKPTFERVKKIVAEKTEKNSVPQNPKESVSTLTKQRDELRAGDYT